LGQDMVPVADALELAEALETSLQVRQCVSEHLYRYALGASPSGRGAQCLVDDLADAWQQSAGEPSSVIDRLVRSEAFRRLANGSGQ